MTRSRRLSVRVGWRRFAHNNCRRGAGAGLAPARVLAALWELGPELGVGQGSAMASVAARAGGAELVLDGVKAQAEEAVWVSCRDCRYSLLLLLRVDFHFPRRAHCRLRYRRARARRPRRHLGRVAHRPCSAKSGYCHCSLAKRTVAAQ